MANEYASKGYAILAEDECSTIMGWNDATGWLPKGLPITAPTTLSKQRFYTFGALGCGIVHYTFHDKANSDSFLEFLESAYDKFGKFVMFLDNASYHKSKKIQEGLKKFGNDIILEFFLPYTPELNPVEGQWKTQKQHVANRIYSSIKDMQEAIGRMYASGEIKVVKMHDYLNVQTYA